MLKVRAVILNPDSRRLHVVNVQDDSAIDPLELLPADWCPIPTLVASIYDGTRTAESPQLAKLLTNVFSHKDGSVVRVHP